jgi:hypothetical protein
MTVSIIDSCDDRVDGFEYMASSFREGADDREKAGLFIDDSDFVGESAGWWRGKFLRVKGQSLADFGGWCWCGGWVWGWSVLSSGTVNTGATKRSVESNVGGNKRGWNFAGGDAEGQGSVGRVTESMVKGFRLVITEALLFSDVRYERRGWR